jgi:beta-glucosidase
MPAFLSIFSKRARILPALFALAPLLAAQGTTPRDSYLDSSLPFAARVDDLVSRMTLAEKIAQMQNDAPAIPRLHIPAYNWWNEGLHGVARAGYATVFPQAIGLAATWDTDLIHRTADAISTEARAKYNQAQRDGNRSIFYGLTFWSPNINIDRDPRWGRGQETYGEDPFLTAQIGSAFVRGLQGDDPRYNKVVATAKHFAVHSGPESERHTFNASVSPYDLEDTYLPAFRALVSDEHAGSVMCAYNSVEGAPACASSLLLHQTLKDDWHFDGYIVSDCGAVGDIAQGHKFAVDAAHAAADAVHAGTDLDCGREYAALGDAVHQGLIGEPEIDAAVKRLFTARFRLGMFDPPADVPFNRIPPQENDSPVHAALALQAASESIVLLKNDPGVLPLTGRIHTLAVVGPNAAALAALEGNYNGVPSQPVTPLAALEEQLPGHVFYAQGASYAEGFSLPVPRTLLSSAPGGAAPQGLKAEYFKGTGFAGNPVLTRIDSNIDFDWNSASPAAGIGEKTFSVRWSGFLASPVEGTTTFGFSLAHCSTCDDAETVRVWLDGKLAYEFIHAATPGRRAPTAPFKLTFADTRPHPLRIEYTHDAPHFGAGLTFTWKPPADALREQAVRAAAQADAVVAFLGLSPDIEGEEMPVHVPGFDGGDRTAIELPETQRRLVEVLAQTGKPLILVLMNGSALALGDAEHAASAILEAWYPGEQGGHAIVDTLLGRNNPSGRLPVTFYASTSQLPPFDDYSMQGRTYRYFTGAPLYPFGYGLSYTSFSYAGGKLSTTELKAGDPIEVTAQLANTGPREGDETVEIYLVPQGIPCAPLRTLVGFQKVHLAAGESRQIYARIDPRQLSLVDADGNRAVRAGAYTLSVGGGQPANGQSILLNFHIAGSQLLDR